MFDTHLTHPQVPPLSVQCPWLWFFISDRISFSFDGLSCVSYLLLRRFTVTSVFPSVSVPSSSPFSFGVYRSRPLRVCLVPCTLWHSSDVYRFLSLRPLVFFFWVWVTTTPPYSHLSSTYTLPYPWRYTRDPPVLHSSLDLLSCHPLRKPLSPYLSLYQIIMFQLETKIR